MVLVRVRPVGREQQVGFGPAAGLVPNGGSSEAMTNTVKQDVVRFGELVVYLQGL